MNNSGYKLAINADDFGLDEEIDRAIIELASKKALSAVSVLISSDSFSRERFASLLETEASIGVHLALTECRPLSADFPKNWLDVDGRFPLNWLRFFSKSLFTRLDAEIIFKEWSMQYQKLESLMSGSGKSIQFLDSHQNVHFWPPVAKVAMRLRDTHSIPYIRVFKDGLRVSKPMCSTALALGRTLFKSRQILPCYGIHQSGQMDFASLTEIVSSQIADGRPAVIVTHPGHTPRNGTMKYVLNWESEYSLIASSQLADWLAERDIEIVNIEQLCA
jgi:predicted glycoside hydrolase/deacetylase ChbG (UPF0249 family)